MQSKKNIFLWVLYDFANSIVSIVFFLYFSQWLVIDKSIPDIRFNLTFTISALALLFTAPLSGSLLDKSLRRITGLRYTTILTAIFYGLCAIFALSDKVVYAIIFFTLGLYCYLLSFTFYTPLINDISSEQKRGKISGLGICANYLGQFAGLLIALPFAKGTLSFFNSSARAETLLPSVIVFLVLSLPMLIFFKEPQKQQLRISKKQWTTTPLRTWFDWSLFFGCSKCSHPEGCVFKTNTLTSLKSKIKETIRETKILLSFSSVALFLLAYFLFNDAILTASNNFPIFLEQVWHVSDSIKTYILLGILVTSAIGGAISGLVADKYGHKKTLMIILAGWIFILPFIGLVTNFKLLIISTILMGFWFGSTWTVSRSMMSCIAPKGKHNLAFSYFGIAERASSLIGPVVWGLIVSNAVWMGPTRYRLAVLAITGFIILGLIALSRVKESLDKPNHQYS